MTTALFTFTIVLLIVACIVAYMYSTELEKMRKENEQLNAAVQRQVERNQELTDRIAREWTQTEQKKKHVEMLEAQIDALASGSSPEQKAVEIRAEFYGEYTRLQAELKELYVFLNSYFKEDLKEAQLRNQPILKLAQLLLLQLQRELNIANRG